MYIYVFIYAYIYIYMLMCTSGLVTHQHHRAAVHVPGERKAQPPFNRHRRAAPLRG